MLTQDTARYIWHCIETNDGFASDPQEWADGCEVDLRDVSELEDAINCLIDSLPEEGTA